MSSDFPEDFPPELTSKLKRAGICTAKQILVSTDPALKNFKLTSPEIEVVRAAAAKQLWKPPIPASKLLNDPHWQRISFGCKSLDQLTNGGVLTRGITEICGESSVGKTQILLQLSLMVQHPKSAGGLDGKGTVFICTEDPFPSKRLSQIVKAFKNRYSNLNINYTENIFVEHILDADKLVKCVTSRLPSLLQNHNIGLIIIDSVAAVYRLEGNIIERAQHMRKLAKGLLSLADIHCCGVVCINQVTSVPGDNTNLFVPCLGLAWANLIRTRLQVWKTSQLSEYSLSNDLTPTYIRKMEVIFSPDVAPNDASFIITLNGVEDSIGTENK